MTFDVEQFIGQIFGLTFALEKTLGKIFGLAFGLVEKQTFAQAYKSSPAAHYPGQTVRTEGCPC